jgi:DNA-nicking Smr family endonuclease
VTRRRQLSDEERALWTGYSRSIKPLREAKIATPSPEDEEAGPSAVRARDRARPQKNSEPRAAPKIEREAKPAKKPPPLAPLGRRLRQRVSRGREPIDARLDLHGKTQSEAHAALSRFLRRAQGEGARMVLVVTGKGTKSASREADPGAGERGVLRRQVPVWLALPEFRAFVIGFEDAHIEHGGAGALYVRLRRER